MRYQMVENEDGSWKLVDVPEFPQDTTPLEISPLFVPHADDYRLTDEEADARYEAWFDFGEILSGREEE